MQIKKINLFSNLLEQSASSYGDSIAVQFINQSLTYTELNTKANQFARFLQTQGITKNTFVGIYVDRCLELPIILMGILKCGAVCVPIDINLAHEHIDNILNTTNLRYIIIRSDKKCCCDSKIKQICYNDNNITPFASDNLCYDIKASDLAFVLHTSGTTGKPKGISIKHQGIVNLAFGKANLIKKLNVSNIRILQFSSIAFDAFISEIAIQLITGGTLVITPKENLLPGSPLAKTLRQYELNLIILSPSILQSIQDEALPHLKIIMSAGEPLPAILANKLSKQYNLINAYGPTETAVCATMYEVDSKTTYADFVPIGKPLKNFVLHILDNKLNPVGKNEPGELYIGGVGLAKNYFNNPVQTKLVFLKLNGQRLYKTGDCVKMLPDGNLQYVGRIDRQVKYHGIRVNLNEIEQILNKHPYIAFAAVTFNEKLVAYIQLNENYKLSISEIRAYLRKSLPTNVIPTKYIFVAQMPLTVSNKIDYQTLAKLKFKYLKTQNKTIDTSKWQKEEKILLKLLQNFTHNDHITLTTDFFDIGIDSFLIVAFVTAIEENFKIEIAFKKIYEQPNIQQLANYIRYLKNGEIVQSKAEQIDFIKEIQLPYSFQVPSKIEVSQPIKNIFLTGSTGFLGIFMLEQLLAANNSNIYCLVRSKNKKTGFEKIKKTAKKYNVPLINLNKLKIIAGDISRPLLGLKKEELDSLNEQIDIIYHAASDTNFTKPYEALKNTNVLGTQEILKLASINRIIPIHYVSTLAVFACIHYFEKIKQVTANSNTLHSAPYLKYDIGYVQSKWVADQIIQEAIKKGFPATIYRPGLILCHSNTGTTAENNFWNSFVQTCFDIGYYPGFKKQTEEFVSVDYVSKSIIYLSQHPNSNRTIYHLSPTSTNLIDNDVFFKKLGKLKKRTIYQIPYYDWLDKITQNPNQKYLLPFMPLLKDKVYKNLTILELYQNTPVCPSNCSQILTKANITDVAVEQLLKVYCDTLQNKEVL